MYRLHMGRLPGTLNYHVSVGGDSDAMQQLISASSQRSRKNPPSPLSSLTCELKYHNYLVRQTRVLDEQAASKLCLQLRDQLTARDKSRCQLVWLSRSMFCPSLTSDEQHEATIIVARSIEQGKWCVRINARTIDINDVECGLNVAKTAKMQRILARAKCSREHDGHELKIDSISLRAAHLLAGEIETMLRAIGYTTSVHDVVCYDIGN